MSVVKADDSWLVAQADGGVTTALELRTMDEDVPLQELSIVNSADVQGSTSAVEIKIEEKGGENVVTSAEMPLKPKDESKAATLADSKSQIKGHGGITVTWTDLGLTIPQADGKDVTIIRNLTGHAEPGQVLTVMGPSGAGKTTFLEVLASNMRPTSGNVAFNGKRWSHNMNRMLAYCRQLDLFRQNLTVREHLFINARLRMDARATTERIDARVEEVITRLGLTPCAETLIGAAGGGGISGGERRRLAIGTEILNRPSVLYLDEPTSGLDSFMANSIMNLLKEIANGSGTGFPVTVVSIIHQPSSAIFALFENLMILSKGRTTYFGRANELTTYCSEIGKTCPAFSNPAEFFMDAVSVNPEAIESSLKSIEWACKMWEEGKRAKTIAASTKSAEKTALAARSVSPGMLQQRPSLWTQLNVLMYREWTDRRRNKLVVLSLMMRTLLFGLFLGAMFFELGSGSDQKSTQSVNGALFFLMVNQVFTYVIPTIQTFPRELLLFRREYMSGLYTVTPYYLSKLFSNLPMDVIFGTIFLAIPFYMVDFSSDGNVFGMFMVGMILIIMFALGLGYMVSCVAPNETIGLVMAILCILFPLVPSGFLINLDEVPIYFIWLKEASPFTWAFRYLMVNQWENYGDIACSDRDKQGGFCSDASQPFRTGQDVLRFYGVKGESKGTAAAVLVALAVGYHLTAVSVLYKKTTFWARSLAK